MGSAELEAREPLVSPVDVLSEFHFLLREMGLF